MNVIIVLLMIVTTILAYPLAGDDRKQVSPLTPTAAQNGDTDDTQDDMGDQYEDDDSIHEGVVTEDDEDQQ